MAKQDKKANPLPEQRDDALFEALGKSKKRKKRRILFTVISIILVLAVIAAVGVRFLKQQVREQFGPEAGDILTYEVTTGTISTVVSGSGTLTDVDLQSITVPDGVEITEILVRTNDTVSAGDILATVDMASVMSAMADLQAQIEALDEEISEAEDDEASSSVYAGVSGRVKVIYAQKDTNVADVMYENGALALLSLDGFLAVDIETDLLAAGDSVTVRLSDEKEMEGTVESVSGGRATILVSDNGPQYDETVTVLDGEGTQLGTGNLYIHSPLRVTGYAGTVDRVRVKLNDKVQDSTRLFTLTNTSYTANYHFITANPLNTITEVGSSSLCIRYPIRLSSRQRSIHRYPPRFRR